MFTGYPLDQQGISAQTWLFAATADDVYVQEMKNIHTVPSGFHRPEVPRDLLRAGLPQSR